MRLWSTTPTGFGQQKMKPETPRSDGVTEVWGKLWNIKPALITWELLLQARPKRLLTEVFPVLACGCAAWCLRECRSLSPRQL